MVFYYLFVSLFVSFSLHLFLLFRKHWSYSTTTNLPPGSLGWPVIGESFSFLSAIREGHPEKFFFDRCGADGTAFKTSLLGEPTVVLCGMEGNKLIFSNENKLVTSWLPPNLAKLFFSPELSKAGAEYKKIRKLLPSLLRIEALRHSVCVMDEVARRHFSDEWDGIGRDSAFMANLAKRYTFRVAMSLLASLDDPEEIKRLEAHFVTVEAAILSIPVNLPGTPLNRGSKAMSVMQNELVKVVKKRRVELAEGKAATGQDIISHMLTMLSDDGNTSELDIAKCIICILHGIYGNTSTTCASVVKYLTELPRVYEAVHNEQMAIAKSKAEGELLNWDDLQKMKYSWNVVREVLRITSPAAGNFREAITDFTFGGFSVPKGWKVFWSATATHMNPAYFPYPDIFDPTRFEGSGPAPNTFVAFGSGPRMCIGKEYARVKILVFMYNFIKHCPLEKIVLD